MAGFSTWPHATLSSQRLPVSLVFPLFFVRPQPPDEDSCFEAICLDCQGYVRLYGRIGFGLGACKILHLARRTGAVAPGAARAFQHRQGQKLPRPAGIWPKRRGLNHCVGGEAQEMTCRERFVDMTSGLWDTNSVGHPPRRHRGPGERPNNKGCLSPSSVGFRFNVERFENGGGDCHVGHQIAMRKMQHEVCSRPRRTRIHTSCTDDGGDFGCAGSKKRTRQSRSR